jgi:hypothetical protein
MNEYISLMSQKGVDEEESRSHHVRMGKMKEAFLVANPELGMFGSVDVEARLLVGLWTAQAIY